MMADHFVIDGSNLATEGRTEPSLAQLREAVDAFRGEHPGTTVTVVVDASFEHRIDPSERAAFAKAEIATEVVSPPAGAVGRGDGFLLQIANRTNATVVSNDSFQEFHAEYIWLFEPGRLIGGKPVPGVGWIFSLRRPVRGIVSRKTTQRAKKEARDEDQVRDAIAEATADVMSSTTGRRRRRGSRSGSTETTPNSEPEAVNQPAPFLQFVIDHRLGSQVEGIVDAFSSHGAFVIVGDVRCYVPIAAMGDPRPSKARDVLTRGEARTFVVQAVDAPRRGIELALPGFEKIAGTPSDETVEADVKTSRPRRTSTRSGRPATRPAKSTAPAKKATASGGPGAFETGPIPAPPRPRKAGTANAPTPVKRSVAKKTGAKKTAAKKTVAKKTVAKKTIRAKKQAVAKKATPVKKTAAKVAPVKQAVAKKAAPVKKTVAKKTVAKAAPAKKQAVKKPVAKKTVAKMPAAKKSVAKATPVKKQAAKKATKQPGAKAAPAKTATRRRGNR